MHITASFLILAIQILGSTSTEPAVVSWNTVSDPGTVTFGNVSALTTTAAFSPAGAYAPRRTSQSTTPGNLILMSTFQAISVKAPFSGDDNGNNSALVQFRQTGQTGDSTWLNAYSPFIDRRASLGGVANPYANQARGSIVGLKPNTSYDVRVTWSDTDGVASQPAITSISTLTYTPPTGGSTITVTSNASLASALSTVQPGQTIHMNPGTYAPFSISRSGTS